MNVFEGSANASFKERLRNVAKVLDDGDLDRGVELLRSLPLLQCDNSIRFVAFALFRHAILSANDSKLMDVVDVDRAIAAFDCIGAAIESGDKIWPAYHALTDLEECLGSADAAAAVAAIFWGRTLEAHEGVFVAVFELFFRGGNQERFDNAWRQFLEIRTDYVPGYWIFLLHAKSLPNRSREQIAGTISSYLRQAGRDDLEPLFAIYRLQMRQADSIEILDAATALRDSRHRTRVAEYMVGMGYILEDLRLVVPRFRELAQDPSPAGPAICFMEARLANAEGRWSDVLRFAEISRNAPEHRYPADLLYANALARLGQLQDARKKLKSVTDAQPVVPFLAARAAHINVTVELIDRGLEPPETGTCPSLQFLPGRPLAQSLWVGRRLRWIERLAIKSYIDNGWRFQLYVYDDVDNVPDGCEVLDAGAIIPKKEVFREGYGSGLHAGSVGAFSDLFRYRMLCERGGMWTDTDVINRRKFDPDGKRFVSTEVSDAGLISLNGAMMAAPAGDPFVGRAYERACELLHSEKMFFTRIGPYLLAELLVEAGVDGVELMPPSFLSPISWANTAVLLKSYDVVAGRPEVQSATNIHVYTEMWRMLGLGLDRPPDRETFLGRLYESHFGSETQHWEHADT